MSAMNTISTRTNPAPAHSSQRPPLTLNEKLRGSSRAFLAAGWLAKMRRISPHAFT